MIDSNQISKSCPNCAAKMPIEQGYEPWCDQCNYGVVPNDSDDSKSWIGKVQQKRNERSGQELYNLLSEEEFPKPRLGPRKLIGFVIATFAMISGPIFLIMGTFQMFDIVKMSEFVRGVLLLAFSVAFLPRGFLPPQQPLTREEAPTLFMIIERTAQKLNAPMPVVTITNEWNASFRIYNWRGNSEITLGLPILNIFTPEETVAVVAHELAHGLNGDGTRGIWIGMVLNSIHRTGVMLENWAYFTHGTLILPIIFLTVVIILKFIYRLLLWCASEDQQRAEYLADDLASNVSGSEHMISSFAKLNYLPTYHKLLYDTAAHRFKWNVFDIIFDRMKDIPQREIDRMSRANMLTNISVDTSHPPTVFRIARLKKFTRVPQVIISTEEAATLRKELRQFHSEFQKYALAYYKYYLDQ